jgi:hypothetical protein
MKTEAYWISPKGNIHEVNRKHINFISENKEMFGLTEEEYYKCFDKYDEPYGFEGYAREELMRKQFSNGWIRCRYRPDNHYWVIELYELTENTTLYLSRWANIIYKTNVFENTKVIIKKTNDNDDNIIITNIEILKTNISF